MATGWRRVSRTRPNSRGAPWGPMPTMWSDASAAAAREPSKRSRDTEMRSRINSPTRRWRCRAPLAPTATTSSAVSTRAAPRSSTPFAPTATRSRFASPTPPLRASDAVTAHADDVVSRVSASSAEAAQTLQVHGDMIAARLSEAAETVNAHGVSVAAQLAGRQRAMSGAVGAYADELVGRVSASGAQAVDAIRAQGDSVADQLAQSLGGDAQRCRRLLERGRQPGQPPAARRPSRRSAPRAIGSPTNSAKPRRTTHQAPSASTRTTSSPA